MACTATATKAVAAEIAPASACASRSRSAPASTGPTSPSTSCGWKATGSKARRLALLEAGLADPDNRPAIVYCGTRRTPTRWRDDLRDAGLRALPYHAGMEAEDRDRAQHRFMAGEVEVIVATNAFGMGVDKADVRSVWHMAIPTSLEAYYQEAGRAGRDGLPGESGAAGDARRPWPAGPLQRTARRDPDLAIARERGWRDYRTIKSFIYSDRCRRRSSSTTSATATAGRPLERCCDVCDPQGWLPDPETIAVRGRAARKAGALRRRRALGRRCAALRALKAWRLRGRRRQAGLHGRPQHDPWRRSPHRPADEAEPGGDQRHRPELRHQVRARSARDRRLARDRASHA